VEEVTPQQDQLSLAEPLPEMVDNAIEALKRAQRNFQ
jgi:hypothetical protein